MLGTFLRGPNWNFFGPFEYWDAHKVEVLNNVDLSQYFWVDLLGRGLPKAPHGFEPVDGDRVHPGARSAGHHRGACCTSSLLPPLLAVTVFRKFFVKMGFLRYMLMSNLLLFMVSLPIKMVLRWTVNLKYIICDSGILPELLIENRRDASAAAICQRLNKLGATCG